MQAIHTKFIAPTNSRGARVKAYTVSGFSATIGYPYEFNHEMCHYQAVKALVAKHKLNWNIENMRHGDSADGRGYVFCFDASKVTT